LEALLVNSESINAEACVAIASRIGLHTWVFAMSSSAVEQSMTANARRAFERGAFGIPTFFMEDTMFSGNDRLALLDDYLSHKHIR
jgi:2-hydroxychromene-2-carboxylate isomerase